MKDWGVALTCVMSCTGLASSVVNLHLTTYSSLLTTFVLWLLSLLMWRQCAIILMLVIALCCVHLFSCYWSQNQYYHCRYCCRHRLCRTLSHILILTSRKTFGIQIRQIIQFTKQLLPNQTSYPSGPSVKVTLHTIIKQLVVGWVYLLSCFIVYCGSTTGVNSIHQAHHTYMEQYF